jgi:UDP-N-acetylglucosamine 2-epimerase (non-hydrolysing)
MPKSALPEDPLKVLVLIGTRPEAVKLAPVAIGLADDQRFAPDLVNTGQHQEMLDPIADLFGLSFSKNFDVLEHGQGLATLTTRVIEPLDAYVASTAPDAIVVQGDTTSTFVGSLVAHYNEVPCAHVEAGLRTNDIRNPFPEEANRRLTSTLADLHLSPTASAAANLAREGIDEEAVVVTGNTVIDALQLALTLPLDAEDGQVEQILDSDEPVLLVTSHRRESWGEEMVNVAAALRDIADSFPSWRIVFPIHRNPIVREAFSPALDDLANVTLLEPLPYVAFVRMMQRARIILTDSGGVQEEAPSLGRPVLVMRRTTERPEAVEAGTARLVGTNRDALRESLAELIQDSAAYERMATAANPFGDGRATSRILDALAWRYLGGVKPEPFRCA